MKNSLLLTMLLLGFTAMAQNVYIPDNVLKAKLLNHNPVIDTNADGEIQISEAEAFTGNLNLSYQAYPAQFNDPTGLEAFVNITGLDATYNLLSNIDLSSFSELENLNLRNNQLTSIDISQNSNLATLNLENNDFTNFWANSSTLLELNLNYNDLISIDLAGLPNLEKLELVYNELLTIDLLMLPNLEQLSLDSNPLTGLDLSANTMLTSLSLFDGMEISGIPSLDLSANVNLVELVVRNQSITDLDISALTSLETAILENNELNALDISQNNNLITLNVKGNNIETFSVNNPALTDLNIQNNIVNTINFISAPTLKILNVAANNLNSLDVSNLLDLEELHMWSNPISQLDLSVNENLISFSSGGTEMIELDFSNNPNLQEIQIGGEENLVSVNLRNGNTQDINLIESFYDCPNLEVVCVDSVDVMDLWDTWILNNLQQNGTVVTSYCSFTPAQSNIIEGELKYNTGDGCDAATALALPNTLIKSINSSNSSGTFTGSNGQFLIYTDEGVNTTYVMSELPPYFSTTPGSHISNFTGYGNTDIADFCMDSNQTMNDLNVMIFSEALPRPGFPVTYKIVYENMGTTTLSGEVVFEFDDEKQNFIDATPAENSSASNIITFQFQNLPPLQNAQIEVEMQNMAPPIVNSGEDLSVSASITPNSNDYTPGDNSFGLVQNVVNSYDPNDKQVLEGNEIELAQADEYLHYMIRFQNTGTASAINVVVADSLHSDLNWNSMRMVAASHEYRAQITNDNFVEFIFEGIDLPHETADEAGSNGYIVYKIKPNEGFDVGDYINGKRAKIFFDYNEAITTNQVSTHVIDNLSTHSFEFEKSINVYPNPSAGIVNISAGNGMKINKVEIFSITGQKLLQKISVNEVDISFLPQGIYFVKIYSVEGAEVVRKLVKE